MSGARLRPPSKEFQMANKSERVMTTAEVIKALNKIENKDKPLSRLFTSRRFERSILEDEPEPESLPDEDAMTIVLGFQCGPLSVVASDSEITVGGEKIEGGKLTSMWRAEPSGAIMLGNAGSLSYAQTLASELRQKFDTWQSSVIEFETWAKGYVHAFYMEHVFPLLDKLEKPPHYRLLIMANHNREQRFWSTDKTVLVPETTYKAIGIGGPTATGLLNTLYRHYLNLNSAAILASYIVYRVKRSISGCGFDTEIRFMYGDRTGIVPSRFIERCEELFRRYERVNKDLFYFAIGTPLSDSPVRLPKELEGKFQQAPERTIQDVMRETEDIRAEFSKLEVIPGNKVI
jgi:ATP-dependent protease HslVU (ClpYQ) peptidase subunit